MKLAIEVCILAGGRSSRMGRDKGAIALNGKKMLARIKAEAEKTGWPVRVVRKDVVERCGPLGGVYTGLKKANEIWNSGTQEGKKAKAVLFIACDMPFVSVELLERVAAGMTAKVDAVFTRQEDFATFPFAVRANAIDIVCDQIESGDFSLQTLSRRLKAKFVRAKAVEVFDVDTPEDLASARKRLKS